MEAEVEQNNGGDLINMDTSGAVEMKALDPGEYEFRIIKAEMKSGDNYKGLSIALDPFEVMDGKYVNDMIFFPREDATEKQINAFKSRFGAFKRALGYSDSDSFTPKDLEGKTCWAVVRVEETAEYGRQNRIVRYVDGASEL